MSEKIRTWFPVVLAIFSVTSIHMLQLRHLLLGDLQYLSDSTFFADLSMDFLTLAIKSGLASRVLSILLPVGFVPACVSIFSFFFYFRSNSREDSEFKAKRAESAFVTFADKNRLHVEIFLFVCIFGSSYLEPSFLGFLLLLGFIVGGIGLSLNYLSLAVPLEQRSTDEGVRDALTSPDAKRRTLLLVSLALAVVAYIAAAPRASAVKSRECLQLVRLDGKQDCIVLVGKSSTGIFGYQHQDLQTPVFYPFDGFLEIGVLPVHLPLAPK